jgi:hypothetical protein
LPFSAVQLRTVLANVLRLLGRPGTILGLFAIAGAGFAIAAKPSRDGTSPRA